MTIIMYLPPRFTLLFRMDVPWMVPRCDRWKDYYQNMVAPICISHASNVVGKTLSETLPLGEEVRGEMVANDVND